MSKMIVLAALLGLAGCSTTPTMEDSLTNFANATCANHNGPAVMAVGEAEDDFMVICNDGHFAFSKEENNIE